MTVTRPVQTSMFPDVAPDKPTGKILPSVITGTNADLMAAVAPYYLTGSVCDVTYGEGAWWARFQPAPFVAHDLYKLDGVDFRALPEDDDTYDAVCFDPPYVLSGGDSSTNLTRGQAVPFQDRYGVGITRLESKTPSAFDALLAAGLAEAGRVSRDFVLVKCMEFASGEFHDVPFRMRAWAHATGLCTHDVIVHHAGSGPGGHNIFEAKRARRHHSYLLVFRKART